MTVTYENLTVRARKAFDTDRGMKAFANLPTETQDALISLESFLRNLGVMVRSDASPSGRRYAVFSLRVIFA